MNTTTAILLFAILNFLLHKQLYANGFPKLSPNGIYIDMKQGTAFTGKIFARKTPFEIPTWMNPNPIVFPRTSINVYIQRTARTNRHFGTYNPLATWDCRTFFEDRVFIPNIAYWRFGEDMQYTAKNFDVYNASKPHTNIQPYGYIYVTSTDGNIYSTFLQVHPEEVLLENNQKINNLRRRGKFWKVQSGVSVRTPCLQRKEKTA